MTILDKIIAYKRKELKFFREHTSLNDLEKSMFFSRETVSLSQSLSDHIKTGIIAEFKRKSPSKGIINPDALVANVTQGYAGAGASGLSILTDRNFFGGSCDDLMLARELNVIPILRKDFIIDEIQVVESKAAGADAILLIAAALEKDQVHKLSSLSNSLGMEVILEIHTRDEIEMVCDSIDIIGVNNRDLRTFDVNINRSIEIADKIPGQFLKISESGISSPSAIKYLKQAGYNGFLIGEYFMKKTDPVSAFSAFIKEIL
ncbi:MAG: indole-3-glycerol phosphate synthase TrpC [Bacteroidales bacterium]|nr:indole-3-glycerol phosphate synthase TrpC [Bacteroidales bacterium]